MAVPALAQTFPAPAPATPALTPEEALRLRRTPVVEVFEACKEAVVNISATQIIKVQTPMGIDSLFDQLFESPDGSFGPPTQEYKQTSLGSGFVIHSAGYIVTNAHVVARAAQCRVIFADKKEYDATIVANDPQRDLAVLKIEADHPLKTLRLGHSSDLMIGETAIAIGNPLGYQHTVTAGVVSALDRSIDAGNGVSFKGLIQTDASINPGNSGGPLLNVLGELIGINTAIRGDAQNIGFAIPVDYLRQALPEVLDSERRRRRLVTGLHFAGEGTAKLSRVDADSPAFQAGLEAGDVIIRLNDQPVETIIDFDIALISHHAGDVLHLVWTREEKAYENTLTIAERARPDGAKLLAQKLGLDVEPVSIRLSRSLHLRGLRGLEITNVEEGSPADGIGIRKGDIIDQLGGHQPATIDDAGEILEKASKGEAVPISILRIHGGMIERALTRIEVR